MDKRRKTATVCGGGSGTRAPVHMRRMLGRGAQMKTADQYKKILEEGRKKRQQIGQLAEQRVQKLESTSKEKEKRTMLNLCKYDWKKDRSVLDKEQHDLEWDIQVFLNGIGESEGFSIDGCESLELFVDFQELLHMCRTRADVLRKEADIIRQAILELQRAVHFAMETVLSTGDRSSESVLSLRRQVQEALLNHQAVLNELETEQVTLQEDLAVEIPVVRSASSQPVRTGIDTSGLSWVHPQLLLSLEDQLVELDNEWESHIVALRERQQLSLLESFREIASLPLGGWEEKDHFHFTCIIGKKNSSYFSREAALKRLSLELPHIPRAEIRLHMQWHKRVRGFAQQISAAKSDWNRAQEEYLHAARDSLEDAAKERENQLQREHCKQEASEQRRILHQQVNVLRAEKVDVLANQRLAEQKVLKEEQKRERLRVQRREVDLELKKAKATIFRKEKELRSQEERAREQDAQKEIQRKTLQRIRETAPRVAARAHSYSNRQQERKQVLERHYQDSAERKQVLDLLSKKAVGTVARDPERVFKETAASRAQKEAALMYSDFRPDGYSDECLSGDSRFRITEALREAGMLHTEYSRNLLAQMARPRFDTLTTEQREQISSKRF